MNKESLQKQELSVVINEQIKKLVGKGGNLCVSTFGVNTISVTCEELPLMEKDAFGKTLGEALGKIQKVQNIENKEYFDEFGKILQSLELSLYFTRNNLQPVYVYENLKNGDNACTREHCTYSGNVVIYVAKPKFRLELVKKNFDFDYYAFIEAIKANQDIFR